MSQAAVERNQHETEITRWVRTACSAAEDKLGEDTKAFFVGEILGVTDWFVITSAKNERQVKALAEEIELQVKTVGGPSPRSVEGKESSGWMLIDFGEFVVHIFTSQARQFYNLEKLWRDVPQLETEAPKRGTAS